MEHAIASEQQDLVAHGGAGTMGTGVSEVAAPPPCAQPGCRRGIVVRDEDVHRVHPVVLGVVGAPQMCTVSSQSCFRSDLQGLYSPVGGQGEARAA